MAKLINNNEIKVGQYVEIITHGGFPSNQRAMGMVWQVESILSVKMVKLYQPQTLETDTFLIKRLRVVPDDFVSQVDPLNIHGLPLDKLHSSRLLLLENRKHTKEIFTPNPSKIDAITYIKGIANMPSHISELFHDVSINDKDKLIAYLDDFIRDKFNKIHELKKTKINGIVHRMMHENECNNIEREIMRADRFLESIKNAISLITPFKDEWKYKFTHHNTSFYGVNQDPFESNIILKNEEISNDDMLISSNNEVAFRLIDNPTSGGMLDRLDYVTFNTAAAHISGDGRISIDIERSPLGIGSVGSNTRLITPF